MVEVKTLVLPFLIKFFEYRINENTIEAILSLEHPYFEGFPGIRYNLMKFGLNEETCSHISNLIQDPFEKHDVETNFSYWWKTEIVTQMSAPLNPYADTVNDYLSIYSVVRRALIYYCSNRNELESKARFVPQEIPPFRGNQMFQKRSTQTDHYVSVIQFKNEAQIQSRKFHEYIEKSFDNLLNRAVDAIQRQDFTRMRVRYRFWALKVSRYISDKDEISNITASFIDLILVGIFTNSKVEDSRIFQWSVELNTLLAQDYKVSLVPMQLARVRDHIIAASTVLPIN